MGHSSNSTCFVRLLENRHGYCKNSNRGDCHFKFDMRYWGPVGGLCEKGTHDTGDDDAAGKVDEQGQDDGRRHNVVLHEHRYKPRA